MKPLSGNKYKVVGVMSGTSLDGMDLAACKFEFNRGKWSFNIVEAETISYDSRWIQKLKTAPTFSGEKLMEIHSEYGRFIGKQVNAFIKKTGFMPEIISSHGHTVFHQPENGFTFQIGNGANIAAATNITTIADFRTGDVALGGQGAPLVPIGDQLLFSDFDYCLNLGGFANISFEKNKKSVAFDICPVNIVLNFLAEKLGLPFDRNGELGKKGIINENLLQRLNNLDFYKKNSPKSLGREWLEDFFLPVVDSFDISEQDKLRTLYEHIALQIVKTAENGEMLVTGGGALNTFLLERIRYYSDANIVVPSIEIINYKEALIFAFLGVLKLNNQINCLSSVTGASKDSSAGIIFKV